MPISSHPERGMILRCHFGRGFKAPEMVKERLVVVLSPKITTRPGLTTVVALSTSPPEPVLQYHCQIDVHPPLPPRWKSTGLWVKGDMVNAVGFRRLDFLLIRREADGKRIYYLDTLSETQMKAVCCCALRAQGFQNLTKHL